MSEPKSLGGIAESKYSITVQKVAWIPVKTIGPDPSELINHHSLLNIYGS